jgi:hypothetical protein
MPHDAAIFGGCQRPVRTADSRRIRAYSPSKLTGAAGRKSPQTSVITGVCRIGTALAPRDTPMSQGMPDTPSVARVYCPGCEPEADPTSEILDLRWCEPHSPMRDGVDDTVVTAAAYLSGSAEAGGDDNRAWCALFHRRN